MEKHKSHHRLEKVKELAIQGQIRTTFSASTGAAELGFDDEGVRAVVLALRPLDFHKSMTTFHDHREWQDVYRPLTASGQVYLKLTVRDRVVVVSFKEL